MVPASDWEFGWFQTSLQREPDALRTLNSLAAKVDLALATVETRGKDSLAEQPINDFISTDKSLAGECSCTCLLAVWLIWPCHGWQT